jgi:hypothetical protein
MPKRKADVQKLVNRIRGNGDAYLKGHRPAQENASAALRPRDTIILLAFISYVL